MENIMSKSLVLNVMLSDLAKSLSIDLKLISEISLRPLSSPHFLFLKLDISNSRNDFERNHLKKNFFKSKEYLFRRNTGRQFKIKRLT